jgi:hypothetical protein
MQDFRTLCLQRVRGRPATAPNLDLHCMMQYIRLH